MSYIINTLGLMFDIIGVVMLYFYGLPATVDKNGYSYYIAEDESTEEKDKWKRYHLRSKVALTFILIGFACQVASNVMSLYAMQGHK